MGEQSWRALAGWRLVDRELLQHPQDHNSAEDLTGYCPMPFSLDPSPVSACTADDLRKRSIWPAPYWCASICDVSAGQGIDLAGTGAWHE
jgi:hypothetical protein